MTSDFQNDLQIVLYNSNEKNHISFWDTKIMKHSIYTDPNIRYFLDDKQIKMCKNAKLSIKSFSDFHKPKFTLFSNSSKHFSLDVIKRWFYVLGNYKHSFLENPSNLFSLGIENVLIWYKIYPDHPIDLLSMLNCIFSVEFFIQNFFFFSWKFFYFSCCFSKFRKIYIVIYQVLILIIEMIVAKYYVVI